jgi:hypothetical protein
VSSDQKNVGGETFDVVLVHGKTTDGEGACVLRARPGKLEAGEVRPLREGRPLPGAGEVVSLSPRPGLPNVHDVKVEYQLPGAAPAVRQDWDGPAQVATAAYRASWERTFGRRGGRATTN